MTFNYTRWAKSFVTTFSKCDIFVKIKVFIKTKNTPSKNNSLTYLTILNHLILTSSSKDIVKSLERSKTRSMGEPCISMEPAKSMRVNKNKNRSLRRKNKNKNSVALTVMHFAAPIEIHGFPIDRVLERSKLLTISLESLVKIK